MAPWPQSTTKSGRQENGQLNGFYPGTKERKLTAMRKLKNHQPHQPSKQSHVADHPKQTSATSGKDNCSWFQSRKEHHIANIKPVNPQRNAPTTSTGSVSCLYLF